MEIIDHQELVEDVPPPIEQDIVLANGLTERQRRIQRCLACLSARPEGDEAPIPLTMPNLSACLGIRIESQHLRPFIRRGELQKSDELVPASPFAKTKRPSHVYNYRGTAFKDPDCRVQQKLYENILRSRSPLHRSIIASLITHAQRSPYFTRPQIIESIAAKRAYDGYTFFSKIIELGYIQSTQQEAEAGAEIFTHTPAGIRFLRYAQGFLQIDNDQTGEISFKTDPEHTSELDRRSLTKLELGILTIFANSEPPYSIPAIALAYPASTDKISDLLAKLEARGYFSRIAESTTVTQAKRFVPTDSGRGLLDFHRQQTEDSQMPLTYPQLALMDYLIKQKIVQKPEQESEKYSFAPEMRMFTQAQLTAYLYLNNIDTVMLGKAADAKLLATIAEKQGYDSLEAFAQPVQEAVDAKRNIAERCIACIALRGIHQPATQIRARDIAACNPGTNLRTAGVALQEAYNQPERLLRRTVTGRARRYTLTERLPQKPLLNIPEMCSGFTPLPVTELKRPRRNLEKFLHDIEITDHQKAMLTYVDTYLSHRIDTSHRLRFLINVAHCIKYGLLDVDGTSGDNPPPAPSSDLNIPRLIIGKNLIHESEVFQRAVMHGLGFDLFVYGERLNPLELKASFELRMTQTLKSFAKRYVENNYRFKVEETSI